MIEAVVFDIDQTLWDFHSLRREGLDACLKLLRLRDAGGVSERWTIDDLQHRFDQIELADSGASLSSIRMRSLTEAAAEAAPDDRTLATDLRDLYFEHRHGPSKPYPDVEPALEALKSAGYALGVVSNGNSRLDQLGLSGWWDVIVLGPEIGLAKPDIAIFELTQAQLGYEPHQLVCVGDDPENDVLGAQAAGWRAIWNRRCMEPSQEAIVPDAVVTELTELPSILADW